MHTSQVDGGVCECVCMASVRPGANMHGRGSGRAALDSANVLNMCV